MKSQRSPSKIEEQLRQQRKELQQDVIEAMRFQHQRQQQLLIGGQATTASQDEEMRRRAICEEDSRNMFGVQNLRQAGYDDMAILSVQPPFPLHVLWATDFDAALLRTRGRYSAGKLRRAGYSCAVLYASGYSISELKKCGFTASDLCASGVNIDQLRHADYSDVDIVQAGYNINTIKQAGYDAGKLFRQKMSVEDLLKAGFSPSELRAAGLNAVQLRQGGVDDASALRAAGYDLKRLKAAGFDAGSLRLAGYDFDDLKSVGFIDERLFEAGFEAELERDVLIDFFHKTHGEKWIFRRNWNSDANIGSWYGVKVEYADYGQSVTYYGNSGATDERVVELDLKGNNLNGILTERLKFLRHLRKLNLSRNQLFGPIPDALYQLPNLKTIDLSENVNLIHTGEHDPFTQLQLQQQHGQGGGAQLVVQMVC